MPRFTLPNGIELDTDAGAAPTLQNHAAQKGFPDLRVFVATHPGGRRCYVVAERDRAIFEHAATEDVWAFIDRMALARDTP